VTLAVGTGARVADYAIQRSLGSGPRGEVYLATRPRRLPVDVDVVALRLHRALSTAETFHRAAEDLRFAAAQRSPYLLTIFEAGQQSGAFYVAMEYLAGGSLAAPTDPTRALRDVADAARAAADLHAAGLVHRGISPGNVLVAAYGAKLADPNLTHIFTPGRVLAADGGAARLGYTDPGLLRGEPARPHHDVWALGAVLHRVAAGTGLYGDLPADGPSALRRVLTTPPAVSAALPAALADLVHACLAGPADRPSAAEVAERLDGR
jgi:serine/threonine protein kinase